MTMRQALDRAAEALDIPGGSGPDGSVGWSIAGVEFARLDPTGTVATFRLDAILAGAARRTPDVDASPRGPEWVAFAPRVVDGHAVDRATAWFEAAARRTAP